MTEVTFVCKDYLIKKMVSNKIWKDFEDKLLDFWEYGENEVAYKYRGQGFVKL